MTSFASTVTRLLSIGVVLGNVAVIIFAVWMFYFLAYKRPIKGTLTEMVKLVGRHGLLLGFLVSLSATLGSFYYSDIVGFAPCILCWYQRIFVFSQAVLFAVALYRKDDNVLYYSAALSIIGGLIALYHYVGQMFLVSSLPCTAAAASCAKREFIEFGYITIPMMALTYFAIMLTIVCARHAYLKRLSA